MERRHLAILSLATIAASLSSAASGQDLVRLPDAHLTSRGEFGTAVAVDGRLAVVGAPGDEELGVDAGAAYVYSLSDPVPGVLTRAAPDWTLVGRLTAFDGFAGDRFGESVAISGETIFVGAPRAACGSSEGHDTECGAVYVFTNDGTGGWNQSLLEPSHMNTYGIFGWSLDAEGDRLLVGAYGDGRVAEQSGAGFIFEREDSGEWTERASLLPSDGDVADWTGYSVGLSGDVAVLGAYNSAGPGGLTGAGSVYIFERSPAGHWKEVGERYAADAEAWDHVGRALAVEGDLLIAGSHRKNTSRGAAYLFRRTGGTWIQEDKWTAPGAGPKASFGTSIDIEGEVVAIAAPGWDVYGPASGVVFTRRFTGGAWTGYRMWLPRDGDRADKFGLPVTLKLPGILFAAPGNDILADNAGAVYAAFLE